MKSKILPIVFSVALALPALAGKAVPNASKEPCTGKIVYVAEKKTSISVKPKGAETSTGFKISADTKITLDGAAATATDLHKDWKAVVTPKADDVAIAAEVAMTKGSDAAPKKPEAPAAEKTESEP